MDVIPLASDFARATQEAWAALVEKTLKGPGPESLTFKSFDGVRTQALYTRGSVVPSPVHAGPSQAREAGRWDIRTVVAHPDATKANAQALQDLENGASSLLLRLDPAGVDGVAVGSAEDLATVLAGVEIELATVALDAGHLGVEAAEWLHMVAKSAPQAKLALHLDPLSVFAAHGASRGPIADEIARGAACAARLHETYPLASAFLASGAVAHEAGGSEALELAVMLSAALTYLRALAAAGVEPREAFPLVTLGVSADETYFVGLAKLRAARELWARLGRALRCGGPAWIEARSSRRMLSKVDPWVNLLRLTAAGFGAAVGGADAIVLEPFTQPLGAPTDFARRQARNAQLVLLEESGLGRVADPAGGAWFLESQTDQLARAAWSLFQQIEAAGGLVAALCVGLVQGWAASARMALEADLASGTRKLIGVTVFRNPNEATVGVETIDPTPFVKFPPAPVRQGPDDACPPLRAWRMAEAFEAAAKGGS